MNAFRPDVGTGANRFGFATTGDGMTRIVVLMTCYNRREKTLACLAALYRNLLPAGTKLGVVLVDDGSADGTGEAVANAYPDVEVVCGNGNLFWNGGMRLAWEAAQTRSYDYLLWLNDDTLLDDDTIRRLLATEAQLRKRLGRPAIIVGSTRTPGSEIPSYGGEVRRHWLRTIRFELIQPGREAVECDTMDGNCVLVSREISLALGNLEPRFVHAMGDTDYGLRTKAIGYSIWVMPGYAGTCVNDNLIAGSFNDATLPLAVRMHKILSPKGLPPRPWLVFTRRHAGVLWPLHWVWPYGKVVMTSLKYSVLNFVARRGGRA